jgi:light-harvesting complex II chlorophyll a/b binding protein 5
VEKYRVNELLHARWAMLAAAGILIPEALEATGSDIVGGTWFETGSKMLNGGTLNWSVAPFGVIPNPLPLAVVAVINAGLLAAVEQYRAKGEGPAGYSPGVGKFDSDIFAGLDPLYPGGPFDPLVSAGQSTATGEVLQHLGQQPDGLSGRRPVVLSTQTAVVESCWSAMCG